MLLFLLFLYIANYLSIGLVHLLGHRLTERRRELLTGLLHIALAVLLALKLLIEPHPEHPEPRFALAAVAGLAVEHAAKGPISPSVATTPQLA